MIRNDHIKFLAQCIITGLAIAFLVLMLKPDIFQNITTQLTTTNNLNNSQNYAYSYANAVQITSPAVVSIYTFKQTRDAQTTSAKIIKKNFKPDNNTIIKPYPLSLGSGIIFDRQGFILTNYHVISRANIIKVMLNDGRTATASIVGTDPDTDLAVLKINLADLPSIKLGNSSHIRVGDIVLAIGNPYDVGQTVTQGIVSATGRKGLGLNTYENFIQTDAAINPGNSGGALINAKGELIGISTAIFSHSGGSQGIGFVIPINLAKQVLTDIIKNGEVIRGWLGLMPDNINQHLAKQLGYKLSHGVIITGLSANGPADQAGLKSGDIILSIGQTKIINTRHLMDIIANQKPGSRTMLTGIRELRPFTVIVTIGRRPRQSQ